MCTPTAAITQHPNDGLNTSLAFNLKKPMKGVLFLKSVVY